MSRWRVAILLLWAAALPAAAQQADEAAAEPAGEASPTEREAWETIEEIFEEEEADLGGEAGAYDPEGRRDPFESMLQDLEQEGGEARPPGVPGMRIDEADLTGIFLTASGPVAQVRSARDRRSYLLQQGDRLWDGEVLSVTQVEVVFRQRVDDPRYLKPYREVVKKLNPQPGG